MSDEYERAIEKSRYDKEVREAYKVISRHINSYAFPYDDDPLMDCLSREHPTLQMELVRALQKASHVTDTYADGRYGEDWVRFCREGYVPFI